MGIKGLNTFLNVKYAKEVHLRKFASKTIAVDFSNLIHRFFHRNGTDKNILVEFINFIDKIQRFNINLIFVFDGISSVEKSYIIKRRKEQREKIIKKIETLNNSCIELEPDKYEKIDALTKKIITLKAKHIIECKKLFDILAIPYVHINDLEADFIFKYLLDSKLADVCYSSDTDLIAFGCHTVIKDLQYIKDTVICVEIEPILKDLEISQEQFLYSCIISGTDYNDGIKRSKIELNIKLIKEFITISNLVENHEKINEMYNIYCSPNFEWEITYNIFTELLPEEVKDTINLVMSCTKEKRISNSKVIKEYQDNIIKYYNSDIKYLDTKDNKYFRKLKYIVNNLYLW